MTGPPPTRPVVLIGFMGAGKSSVGRALAQRLEWKFCDLDDLIEVRERLSVAAIFASQGEASFRMKESAALQSLLQEDLSHGRIVVALGGGAFAQPGNREMLTQAEAVTISLEAPLEELERRCQADSRVRPLARDHAEFQKLFASRRAAYQQAQYQIDTGGKSIEQVALEAEQLLKTATRTKQKTKPEVSQ